MKELSNLLSGSWTYRSFHNNPDIHAGIEKLIFGTGTLTFEKISTNVIKGHFDFGPNVTLMVNGNLLPGDPIQLNFRGAGVPNSPTAGWMYDYKGVFLPNWSNGIDQIPAIVGSVIRTAPHGNAKAGYVASFIIVKR